MLVSSKGTNDCTPTNCTLSIPTFMPRIRPIKLRSYAIIAHMIEHNKQFTRKERDLHYARREKAVHKKPIPDTYYFFPAFDYYVRRSNKINNIGPIEIELERNLPYNKPKRIRGVFERISEAEEKSLKHYKLRVIPRLTTAEIAISRIEKDFKRRITNKD